MTDRGDKIPLIYICSSGRSGSTLLDLLLGAHPAMWTMGELHQVARWRREGRACGCGVPVATCSFWRPVLDGVPDLAVDGVSVGRFRENQGQGRVLRWGMLPSVLRRRLGAAGRAEAEAYVEANVRLIRGVRQRVVETTGASPRWLVDASKDPYRLFWLAASGRFDLRVIHLVKDPRGFVWSMTKGTERPWRRRGRFTARWLVENAMMSHLMGGDMAAHGRRLSYETLASQPADTMASLGAWLGLAYSPELIERFREADNHAISGNAMRFRSGPVRLDQAWRRNVSTLEAAGVLAATLPAWLGRGDRYPFMP